MAESAAPIRNVGAPAFAPDQADVGLSATLIVPAREGRRSVLIINHSTVDIYLGSSNVTLLNGLLLTGVKGTGIVIPTEVAIYGIAASGSPRVSFAELYGK